MKNIHSVNETLATKLSELSMNLLTTQLSAGNYQYKKK
jgi:hypothetical protein